MYTNVSWWRNRHYRIIIHSCQVLCQVVIKDARRFMCHPSLFPLFPYISNPANSSSIFLHKNSMLSNMSASFNHSPIMMQCESSRGLCRRSRGSSSFVDITRTLSGPTKKRGSLTYSTSINDLPRAGTSLAMTTADSEGSPVAFAAERKMDCALSPHRRSDEPVSNRLLALPF